MIPYSVVSVSVNNPIYDVVNDWGSKSHRVEVMVLPVLVNSAEFVDYRPGKLWEVDGYWKYRDSAKAIFGNQQLQAAY
jgi:hypothetical protein